MDELVYISSFHKSGTHLIQNLFKATQVRYKYVNGFHIADRAMRKKKGWFDSLSNKKVVIIRNPIEMLVSYHRYIPKTSENWADRKLKKYNGKSFRELFNESDFDSQLKLCTKSLDKTFVGMYETFGKENVLYIKLENFYSEESSLKEFDRIEEFLDINLDKKKLLNVCKTKYNSTCDKRGYTYQDILSKNQISEFESKYKHVLEKLNY
jgi:hypothetical protein